jgi:hypothetical protein
MTTYSNTLESLTIKNFILNNECLNMISKTILDNYIILKKYALTQLQRELEIECMKYTTNTKYLNDVYNIRNIVYKYINNTENDKIIPLINDLYCETDVTKNIINNILSVFSNEYKYDEKKDTKYTLAKMYIGKLLLNVFYVWRNDSKGFINEKSTFKSYFNKEIFIDNEKHNYDNVFYAIIAQIDNDIIYIKVISFLEKYNTEYITKQKLIESIDSIELNKKLIKYIINSKKTKTQIKQLCDIFNLPHTDVTANVINNVLSDMIR